MKKILVFVCATIICGTANAQSFDEFVKQREQALNAMKADMIDYEQKAKEEYQKYEQQAKREYENYLNSVKSIWGGRDVKEDTKKDWVEYGKDYRSRSVVNFENGEIEVEVAIDENEYNKELADKKLIDAVNDLLKSKGNTCPYKSTVDESKSLTKKPVLDGLVDYSQYNIKKEDKKENKKVASAVVKQSKQEKKVVKGEDGKKRVVAKVKMKMVADNLSKNAALYKDIVKKNSERFNIEQPLVFAIMEQESAFNPKATSWVPAYGLMQLVPKSGGLDAYRYVYKKDWAPTKSYLYTPDKNIELGTAYLRVLMNQFSKVVDEDCRRLCVIASYNTGAGNVSRAFTGKTSIGGAVKIINTMTYEQVYQHLRTKLSHAEARDYVYKVSTKRTKYVKK